MNHSAEKREMILEKASTLFSQKGYFGVGINEIVSACDIPKGSFYHYFLPPADHGTKRFLNMTMLEENITAIYAQSARVSFHTSSNPPPFSIICLESLM